METLTVAVCPFVLCDSLYGYGFMGANAATTALIFYG